MKKIIYILALILCSAICFGQSPKLPIVQALGNTDSTIVVTNVIQPRHGLVNGTYADTTAANLQKIRLYPGSQVFITSTNSVWVRNSAATQWIESGTGSGLDESYYGTIYNQKGFTTLDTFIATNVTASVVGGRVSLAGGSSATNFTHTLDLKYQTGLDRWKILIKFVPTTKDASSFGIGIGTHASSTWAAHGFDVVAQINLTNGAGSGVISLQNSNGSAYSSLATSSALSFSANDTILFYLERRQDSLISVAQDLTSGSIVRSNYQYITTVATNPMPNTGYFSLRSFGGTQLIDSMNVTSKAIKNAALVIGSDSKGFYFANAYKNVFGNLVDRSLWSTNLNGGAAEITPDIVHRFKEIQALNPKQFVLETWANDLRAGMTQQQSFDTITLIYNTLTSYGIDVLFLPLYETSENLLPWYQFIKATWPTKVIESYQVMQTAGLLVDGTHFSTAGQDTLSKIIINSFKITSGNNRYEQYNTLQGVTDAGNSTTNNVGINVLNPTVPLQVVNPTSAPAISGSISANTGTEVLKLENTNSGGSAAAAIRFYNNGGLNAQLSLGSSGNAVNPDGISFHSFAGPMRVGSNSDVFEIFTGVLGPSQANVKFRMMNDGRAAIGVNPTPATSALFEVNSTTLGFLMPRMTGAQMIAVVSPATGLGIYNTDSLKPCYYSGSAWVCSGSGSGGASSWNASMTVSPDFNSSYTSNFHSNDWQIQNFGQISMYTDAGSTTRLKLGSTESDLFTPDGASGAQFQDDDLLLKIAAGTATFEMSPALIQSFAGDLANTYSVLDLNVTGANLEALDIPNNKLASIQQAVNGTPIVRIQAASGSPSPSFDNRIDVSDSIREFGVSRNIVNDTTHTKIRVVNTITGAWSLANWSNGGGGSSYTFSTGLTNTAGTITNNLSTGISGGQSVIGGTAANNLLTITGNNAASSNTATNPNIKFAVDNSSGMVAGQIHNNGVWAFGVVANSDAVTYRQVIQQLSNTSYEGFIIYPNANTGTYVTMGYGQILASSDYTFTSLSGRLNFNSTRSFFGGTTAPTAVLHLAAGTATASTAPLKLTSGTNLTTAEPGAFEYNGTNLFFTRTGTTRESVITANAVNSVSPTLPNRTITVVIDGTTYYLSAKTTND